MKRILFALFFLVILTACQPDPRKQAQADQTREQSQQDAANQDQQRQFANDQHTYDMKFNEIVLYIRQKTQDAWIFAKRAMVYSLGISGFMAIFIVLIGLSVGFAWASVGKGRAVAEAAALKASLISPDPITGLFPILRHVHGGKYLAHNPNTGSVMLLDQSNPADARLIHAMQITQATYLEAKYISQSNDPAGAAMINPPMMNSATKEISIGADNILTVEDES